ncbi:MAG: response regulator transcription factor [Rubrobacter sp.]|nr:response regulator transcription factor [Rubrobacter sp.]MBA3789659.1 response regulator transcription factor [Rubrobacter sp.]
MNTSLITGSNMPRIDGRRLVREIWNRSEPTLHVAVHHVTARQRERDLIEGLTIGVDDYVVKPFSSDELAARVHTVPWRSSRGRFLGS